MTADEGGLSSGVAALTGVANTAAMSGAAKTAVAVVRTDLFNGFPLYGCPAYKLPHAG
ncbi:hypothetical protein [Rhodococcus marinonascens]|uniref:hypothetical protein n=1 Tax=Rhodococcus marinonascens TaxID=38311 RepID=UPI000A922ED9|nr:hypothetical protein [Rhodococcus marinonascens]